MVNELIRRAIVSAAVLLLLVGGLVVLPGIPASAETLQGPSLADAVAQSRLARAKRREAERLQREDAARMAFSRVGETSIPPSPAGPSEENATPSTSASSFSQQPEAAPAPAVAPTIEIKPETPAERDARLRGENAVALAKAKAERAARLEAKKKADDAAANEAAEQAAKAKAEQADALAKAKADRAARAENQRTPASAPVPQEAAGKATVGNATLGEASRDPAPSSAANPDEVARLKAEEAARLEKLKAERAARIEAKRIADEEASKVAAENAAKLRADQAEESAKVKAQRADVAARAEAQRKTDAEAARVAAEESARLKAEQAEAAERAKAQQVARLEARRTAEQEAAQARAESAARSKAEQAQAGEKARAEEAARLDAQRKQDEEAARVKAEAAAKAKVEQAEAAERAKVEEAARREAQAKAAAEKAEQVKTAKADAAAKAQADREAREQARQERLAGAARARADAAAQARERRAAKIEADRQAKEAAAREAAEAAKEQQRRDQAALQAYAEAAAPEDSGTVTAVLGSGLMLNWPEASRRIAIADEEIASFHVISPKEVAVYGVKPGRTTIFVWLEGGRRLFYRLLVEHNLEPARVALQQMNPGLVLESGADGTSVILRGEVENEVAARQARSLVQQLLPGGEKLKLINLVRYAGVVGTPEDRLAAAMAAIDPRIQVRRIQSGAEADYEKDSYILEGAVANVNALVQAVVLADRQLGGNGKTVKAADNDRVTFQRSSGGAGGGAGGAGGLGALGGSQPPKNGISAQLARGLLVTSESGRVVSFLKVDSLPQVMVAIRVLEVDRNKARRMGLDVRADAKRLSIGNFTIPGGGGLPDIREGKSTLAGAGNLVGSYVDKTIAIVAALDLMTEKQAARSVAEPNILTLSGEEASVLVGGEVPIPTTSSNAISSNSGFFFQQFGVRLDIRPTVGDGGMVTLEVAPSIVSPSSGLGNGNVPGFTIQRVETTARVQAGESLVLGGLLSSRESFQERGLPLLGKIPLFRWQSKRTENTELLFLITPRIIEPPSDTVRLPPLDFASEPTAPIGLSGLDEEGIPFTFRPSDARAVGQASSCVEVRERPDRNSLLLDCLVPDAPVLVLERKGEWRRVQVPKSESSPRAIEGWARAEGLEVVKSNP